MARWITVAGDLEPSMVASLRNKNSEPITWAGAVIKIQIKKAGAALVERTVDAVLSTDATTARVRVDFAVGDGLEANKDIQARFVATLANGKKISFPKGSTIAIIVNPALT